MKKWLTYAASSVITSPWVNTSVAAMGLQVRLRADTIGIADGTRFFFSDHLVFGGSQRGRAARSIYGVRVGAMRG